MVAEENKRRTIQRSDIANAIARSDLFDFLIDIVPRSEMVRNRSGSLPIRNAVPVASMPPPLAETGRMNDGTMFDPAKGENYMPMRGAHADMRLADDSHMGMKSLHKETIPGEWDPSIYSFNSAPLGMHPGAGLGMPPAHNPGLPMPSQGARGPFLNMVPYAMGDNPHKHPHGAGE